MRSSSGCGFAWVNDFRRCAIATVLSVGIGLGVAMPAWAEDVTETWRDGVTIRSNFDLWFKRFRATLREPDFHNLARGGVVKAYRLFFVSSDSDSFNHNAAKFSDLFEHVLEAEIVARVEILADGSARLIKTYYEPDRGQSRRTIKRRSSRSLGAKEVRRLERAGGIDEIQKYKPFTYYFSCIERAPCRVKDNRYLVEVYVGGRTYQNFSTACELTQDSKLFQLFDATAQVMGIERPQPRRPSFSSPWS